jgi:hypothetical protein
MLAACRATGGHTNFERVPTRSAVLQLNQVENLVLMLQHKIAAAQQDARVLASAN